MLSLALLQQRVVSARCSKFLGCVPCEMISVLQVLDIGNLSLDEQQFQDISWRWDTLASSDT